MSEKMQPIALFKIPLVGARVKLSHPKYVGQMGHAENVIDGREMLAMLDAQEASMFVRAKRASHGEKWIDTWCEVDVRLDSGQSVRVEGREVEVTDGAVRPAKFRSL